MLSGDSEILNDKLKSCFKTNDFSDLDCLFNGRIDVSRELVRRWPRLFEETALKTLPSGEVVEQKFVDYRKWSLPGVIEKLKKHRRELNL